MSVSEKPRVAVIGGGISGLSAAFYLQEQCPNVEITLFEKRERLGGVLHTEHRDGFEIEQSADNFITTVPYGLDLCRALGLEPDVVTTTPRNRQTFILWRGRLHKLPDGFMMMAPSKWWPMAVTRLLSPLGKMRAAMEYFIPARKEDGDESMESFAVRRLGHQVFDRMIEPLVSGVYAADMTKLSLMATLPRFREMEKKHGSLIRAMRYNVRETRKKAKLAKKASRKNGENHKDSAIHAKSTQETPQSGPRYNLFVTVKGGLGRIPEEIAKRLANQTIYCTTQVTSLTQLADGKWSLTWESVKQENLDKNQEEAVNSGTFDAVILATESHNMATLMDTASLTRPAELLAGIVHTGTLVLTAAYPRENVGHPLDGMGAVVPGVEKNPILALSFSNEKYPHRAPEGTVLLRIFSGGARNPEMLAMSEEESTRILLERTQKCLRITGEPLMTSMSRWPETMPQLHMGHLERITELQKELAALPTLAVAGNFLTGVGLPQCIRAGQEAVEKVMNGLK
ncbi:MAG: protoporphyrinogen oxidase [Planctomycetia bacterium]|nr:protoporphyrinogen oxidase [Planctomycetia bacterium]